MAASGRVPTLSNPDATDTETSEVVASVQCYLIMNFSYWIKYTSQSFHSTIILQVSIVKHYNGLQTLGKSHHFPLDLSGMQYPLGTTERELLIGPNHSVTPVKRVVIDNPHTHRRIFYNEPKMNVLIADTVHRMYSFFQTHHILLSLHVLSICFTIRLLGKNTHLQL